ncbi:MAG: alpha/beta fold hydrolase [Gammaproteobacteria bacterium]|nr:MAG: alpha/beta fold hydrolase [Gammaproteobacteria bacterium]
MTTKESNWFIKSIFPTLHALVYLLLFWLVSSFFFRDALRLSWWSSGGFVIGLLVGFGLQWIIRRNSWFLIQSRKITTYIIITLLEFAFGLLVIGPTIWVLNRFVPNSNIHSICCETPKDYGAAVFENIQLRSPDGATIAGWYVAPTQQTGDVIILIHGNGYDRRGTDFQTRALIAAGYGVLLYDLRDHGESVGRLNAFNRMQAYASDLQIVINYLKQKPEINPRHIGVVGISLGSFATLNSTTETLNSFRALWLDGLVFENFGALLPPRTLREAAKYVFDTQTRNFAKWYYPDPIAPPTKLLREIIPTITQPEVMIVASGLDDRERSNNEILLPLMGGNKEMWFIKNAWHIGGRFEVPDEYRERMLAFFSKAFASP